jgi:hypothetical protein
MPDQFVQASNYVHRGDMMVLRSALPLGDPQNWPKLWLAKYHTLDGFPWEETFGRYPTTEELIRASFKECPICNNPL